MIVGGTGIASAVPYIQDHLLRSEEDWSRQNPEEEKTQIQDIELIWSGRQAAFFRDVAHGELKPALGREEFRASFYNTATAEAAPEDLAAIGCEIKSGRPHLLSIILQRARDATDAGASLAIVVSGPVGMAREARAATHFAMRQGYQSIKYVEESFTW
jgi:ferric-chelate reductase